MSIVRSANDSSARSSCVLRRSEKSRWGRLSRWKRLPINFRADFHELGLIIAGIDRDSIVASRESLSTASQKAKYASPGRCAELDNRFGLDRLDEPECKRNMNSPARWCHRETGHPPRSTRKELAFFHEPTRPSQIDRETESYSEPCSAGNPKSTKPVEPKSINPASRKRPQPSELPAHSGTHGRLECAIGISNAQHRQARQVPRDGCSSATNR